MKTYTSKKTSRKIRIAWVESIVDNLPADLRDKTGDTWETVANDIRRIYGDGRYYGNMVSAAFHYLNGGGLHGFPIWTDDQRDQLQAWGYSRTVADKSVDNFTKVAAGYLVEALNKRELI